jgi:hypothetical protein
MSLGIARHLREQVGRDHVDVRGLVGDHEHLGWAAGAV